MHVTTIESRIVEFLRGATGQIALTADTELLEGGIADSLTMMDLMVFIETELRVRLEFADLTAEVFRSPAALAALVATRRGRPARSMPPDITEVFEEPLVYWETFAHPIPLEELGWVNTTYLGTGISHWDPMMVWGTSVDTESLDEFLAEQRRRTGRILSPAHVLVRAVALSLSKHQKVNRRVTGRRVHQYDGVNVVMPMLQTRSGEVDPIFLRRADSMSLTDVAERMWSEARANALETADDAQRRRTGGRLNNLLVALRRRLRLHWIHKMSWIAFYLGCRMRLPTIFAFQQELNGAGAFVNYLGFPGAPPMHSFKPSCLPMNSYSVNVTMGPSEPRPVVVDGDVVIRRQAPLFVRADHRMINAYEAAAFINTLRAHLADPWTLVQDQRPEVRHAA